MSSLGTKGDSESFTVALGPEEEALACRSDNSRTLVSKHFNGHRARIWPFLSAGRLTEQG